jgi:hypothetical protein
MPISRSVIVMGVITAVPFGLAIRETIHHRTADRNADRDAWSPTATTPAGSSDLRDDAAARDRAMAAAAATADAAHQAAREVPAAAMFGSAVATPGAAFHGIDLGASADGVPDDLDVIADGHGQILVVARKLTDDDVGCSTLVRAAEHTWGKPAHDQIWLDAAHGRRASIGTDCALEIARMATPEQWVQNLPFDAIGRPFQTVMHDFAGGDTDGDWAQPGLDGPDVTNVTAVFDVAHPGPVISVIASTTASPLAVRQTAAALADRLHAKPVIDGDRYHWTTPVPVELFSSSGALEVIIGEKAK